MRTLRDFWRWYDGERPERLQIGQLEELSVQARAALRWAVQRVGLRDGGADAVDSVIHQHPSAVRDLSLAVCAALEEMHERVPESARGLERKRCVPGAVRRQLVDVILPRALALGATVYLGPPPRG
jgi:hypothetical protein